VNRTSLVNIEERDVLLNYMRDRGLLSEGEDPAVSILKGGVSSRTVLVSGTHRGDIVVKQALAKLRVVVDWYSDPDRIHREALGLRYLGEICPAGSVVRLIDEDRDQHIIVMEAVSQPHQNWKQLLLEGKVRRDYVAQFAELLATIHRESFLRREFIAPAFADRRFFETLRLEPYYRYSAQMVQETAVFFAALIEETLRTRFSLVHGDYSPKNILIYRGKLTLLDHEVIHFGDPAFDVGFSLAHLLSKAHHLPAHRSTFIQATRSYVNHYLECLGSVEWRGELESRAARHAIGCLLARVVGRSPLEYLSVVERLNQKKLATEMMAQQPGGLAELIEAFGERLNCL
jgi:5-methylthioribose kinase